MWYSNATNQDCKALQRVVRLAERISGSTLSSLQDIYLKRCKSRAAKIIKDSNHPGNRLFILLPSGKCFRSMMAKTERLRRSFFPRAIRLLNSNIYSYKSNQITFIVTSPQHKCLGEWNSYERAPDGAKKQLTIYLWTDSAKNNKQFTYGQTVQKKQQTIYIWTDSAKKLHWSIYSAPDSAKKTTAIYIWTDSAKKQQQFTYGQTVQKNNSNLHMDRQCKKTTAIYIWTDSAKKQQQFTYGQYIFTDCTEDNVQNTHTYTQYA